MFTENDFLKLMKYFKNGTSTGLDNNLIIAAESSKAKTTILFNENIDLVCHSSDDYNRLKSFLITWYSSIKSFIDVMKNVSDIRSLPEDHLNKLIESFGFVDSLEEISRKNKIDFFYDLVNLYKIKGTPEAIERVLGYFGISDIDLVEYWLQYDENRNLVFHPESVSYNNGEASSLSPIDIDYNYIVDDDPHWMLSKDQVNQLFQNNKIAFPSKSPYFGIRPKFQLSGNIQNPVIAILSRLVKELFDSYNSGVIPNNDLYLDALGIRCSLLDLYLGVIYSFYIEYPGMNVDSSHSSILSYNGSLTLTNEEIITLYDTITSRASNPTKESLKQNLVLLENYFTRPRDSEFLSAFNSARDILTSTNSELKDLIDYYNEKGRSNYILKYLLNELSLYVKANISEYSSNLLTSTLGFASLEFIRNVINFFKPYRARLVLVENIYTIENPLQDSLLVEDFILDKITENVLDWDTGNSTGSCCPDGVIPCLDEEETLYYSRNTYDNGSYFDIGASLDEDDFGSRLIIRQEENDYYSYHHNSDSTSAFTAYYTTDVYDDVNYALQAGGFLNFDENGFFDAPQVSDVFYVRVYTSSIYELITEDGYNIDTEDNYDIIVSYTDALFDNVEYFTTNDGYILTTEDGYQLYQDA